jgi:hypothetical protein
MTFGVAHKIATMGLVMFLSGTPALRAEDPATRHKVALGEDYATASKALAKLGAKGEERMYANRKNPDFPDAEIKYHPLRECLDLVVITDKSSGKITDLSLMTTPRHNPVKGLTVSIPLTSIELAADGSMNVSISPRPEESSTGETDITPSADPVEAETKDSKTPAPVPPK